MCTGTLLNQAEHNTPQLTLLSWSQLKATWQWSVIFGLLFLERGKKGYRIADVQIRHLLPRRFLCKGTQNNTRVAGQRWPCKNPAQQRKCPLQNPWDCGLVSDNQPVKKHWRSVDIHMSIFIIFPVHYK